MKLRNSSGSYVVPYLIGIRFEPNYRLILKREEKLKRERNRLTVGSSPMSAKHSSFGLYIPKIDPVDTAASMLDEPSSGSNTTM